MSIPNDILTRPTDTSASPQGGQFSVYKAFRPTIEAVDPFNTMDELFNAIDRSQGEDVLRVRPVSRAQFKDIHNERDRKGRKVRFLHLEGDQATYCDHSIGPP